MVMSMFECCYQSSDSKIEEKKKRTKFLSTTFQNLSFEEQELIIRDLYGQADFEETNDFINDKLEELDSELKKLSLKVKSAYVEALHKQTEKGETNEYITSREFRLMFLRADRFDARLAARRLTMHFKEKLALFGKDKLADRITEEDLDEDDKTALYDAIYGVPGTTDATGRLIGFVYRYDRMFEMNIINVKRAVFYLIVNTLEASQVAQKRGIVGVSWCMGKWPIKNASKLRTMIPLVRMVNRALPFRYAVVHHCYSDVLYHVFLNFVLVGHPKYARDRSQCHLGTYEQCVRELITYGIERDSLPFLADGSLQQEMVNKHLQHLKERCGTDNGGEDSSESTC